MLGDVFRLSAAGSLPCIETIRISSMKWRMWLSRRRAPCPTRRISSSAIPGTRLSNTPFGKNISAGAELFERMTRRYGKPTFGLDEIEVDGVAYAVLEDDRLEPAVLQSAAFRPPGSSRRGRAAEAADRRADVGPLRDPAARHGRGVPAPSRRLHHRLGGRAHGAAGGRHIRSRRLHRLSARDASSISAPACTRSASASRPCRCSRRLR